MSKLPADLGGREVRAALERAGFFLSRQKGSHMVMRRENPFARTIVPNHQRVRVGTLRKILNEAGLSLEEFLALLR